MIKPDREEDIWAPGVRYVRIAFALVYLFFVSFMFWGELVEVLIIHHGTAVDGVVLTEPGHNHGAIGYEYSVGDHMYRGSSRVDRRTEIGDIIQVHYLTQFPRFSTLVPMSSIPFLSLAFYGAGVCFSIVLLCGGKWRNRVDGAA